MLTLDFSTIFRDIHPLTTHFPIALLVTSFFLDVLTRFRNNQTVLKQASSITLLLGVIAAIVTIITGNISLLVLGGEDTPIGQLVSTHESIAVLTTLIFVGLAVWLVNNRRKGKEVGNSNIFLALEIIGVVGLVLTGLAGGNLVYTYGVGVQNLPLP